MKYTIILERQEEGGFTARCVELPGAISEGETMTEALQNVREAIAMILEVLREDLKCLNHSKSEVFMVELVDVC